MGNRQKAAVINNEDYEAFIKNFVIEKKTNDPRFGEIKWLKNQTTGERVIQKDFVTNTQKNHETQLAHVKTHASSNHPSIIRTLGYTTKLEDAFCASHYKISAYLEPFEHDLEEELRKKAQNKEIFNETELWYLLDSLISAGAHLQANDEFHGDLRPSSILVTSARDFKISDSNAYKKENLSTYLAFLHDSDHKGHLYSPVLLTAAENKGGEFDIYKSDIFSLGLAVLELASLEKAESLYDWKTLQINWELLEEQIRNLSKNYTSTFVETIAFMLSQNEAERPDFLKLDAELAPYRNDIRSRILKIQATPDQNIQDSTPDQTIQGANPIQITIGHTPDNEDEELDRRIKEAIQRSQETIRRSPVRHILENQTAYYNHFLSSYASKYGSNPDQLTPQIAYQKKPEINPSNEVTTANYGSYLTNYQPYAYSKPAVNDNASLLASKYGNNLANYRPYEYHHPNTNIGEDYSNINKGHQSEQYSSTIGTTSYKQ